jgi:serine protease Do
MAVAIGNPYGLRFTVTHGVISALDRPVPVEDRVYERLIQTDCAINPGNSGGALINMQGEVIGINTVVLSSAQGIGFAIPIDTALRVAEELKRFGRVKRPWLGLAVVTNTTPLAESYGLPNVAGVVVARLYRNGPGAAAQMQEGDVITKINGTPVKSDEEYNKVEKSLKIGQRIRFEVVRGDQRGSGEITVGEAP